MEVRAQTRGGKHASLKQRKSLGYREGEQSKAFLVILRGDFDSVKGSNGYIQKIATSTVAPQGSSKRAEGGNRVWIWKKGRSSKGRISVPIKGRLRWGE